ncbi:hypothetical protein BRC83_04405 [Halobacteriales archaeon QS_1_68_17]|nr:MAG: hypothetical protein BRC83_04405 [Halobacteriales archaeon QS_1_68_17]
MEMDAPGRFDAAALVGGGCWLVVGGAVATDALALAGPATATLAIALAVFVVVPLVARLADLPFRSRSASRCCTSPSPGARWWPIVPA